MIKRKHYIFVGLIGVALMTIFLFDNDPIKASSDKKVSSQELPQTTQSNSVKSGAAAPQRPLFTITPNELKRMRESLPDTDTVREEVKANPHATPPALLNFARSMGPLMEKALKDSDDAAILINALSDCALNISAAHSARVLCVTNTERLAHNHQHLKAKAERLRSDVDPEVKKILKRQDALKN